MHAARKRLQPEVIAQLVADYDTGMSGTDLMAKYQLGKGTVLGLLRDNGVQLRQRGMSAAQVTEATRLYESGLSLSAVGKRLGIHAGSVHWALRRAEVTMRDAHGR